jgi:hypothetical protein
MPSPLVLLLVLLATTASARNRDVIRPVLREVFTNPLCAETGTCSLREFEVEVVDQKFIWGDGAYAMGPSMVARYRTDSVATLRDYVIVQFIRGCLYGSEVNARGEVERYFNIGRDHYGRAIDFHHPTWVVDSITTDPAYWSDPNETPDRHFHYLWNRRGRSTDERTAVLFGKRRPPKPELYVTDQPSGASSGHLTGPRRPTNVSLAFSTCIYRTRDVSPATPEDGAGLPKPIHCVDWSSSNIFNHATDRFESPREIDPFCLRAR